jgi:hypothetical protein
MTEADPSVSFAIPQPLRAVIGVCLMAGFLGFFVALGIHNLLNGTALIASSLWLLLVGVIFFGLCKERGIKQVCIEIMGAFARKHFVWTFLTAAGETQLRFGYQIFGSRYFVLTVPVDKVQSVHWSTGQASHMSGRDVGDWSVALWYDHGDPAKSQAQKNQRWPDQEVYILGPTGPKHQVAAFGQAFLDFLRQSRVCLVQGENDCTFIRQSIANKR